MNFTSKISNGSIKSLCELATESVAAAAAEEIYKNDDNEIRVDIKTVEDTLTTVKDVLALVIVLDNTASQQASWDLIRNMLSGLMPFLESRHGETDKFSITYEIRIIYANDYDDDHKIEASRAKRLHKDYIADPYNSIQDGKRPVVGELCRISSESTPLEKQKFSETLQNMKCYGGGDAPEAYTPALKLSQDHVNELTKKYGSNAVIATLFCGDDVPHGCQTQHSNGDNWPEGDPSGMDWFEVVNGYTVPIHALSPSHANVDSNCILGYAVSKTGGFHLNVDSNSSQVILRLLMAEMKLSWLMERNLKDMEGASTEEISKKLAELINKESFEKPTNTVPEDPRISVLDEEILKHGFKPNLLRCVSENVKVSTTRSKKSVSNITQGVSANGMLRALRTATGGNMAPNLMRQVSDSVLSFNPFTDHFDVYHNFLDEENIYTKLMNEINWSPMKIGKSVSKRLASFQGVQKEDGIVPWLRCPSIEGQTIHPFTPTIQKIVEKVNSMFNTNVNIVKIQQYLYKNSTIALHGDKVIDLKEGEPIFIVRFGATRDITMKQKDGNKTVKLSMPNNTCFKLTYQDNLMWQHGVLKESMNSDQDTGSISVVLRESVTWRQQNGLLTGPRCGKPAIGETADVWKAKNQEIYNLAMIQAYKLENNSDIGLNAYEHICTQSAWAL